VSLLAVAHRAGNSLSALREAVAAGADVVEADVHHHRGRMEVRHSKSMGPLPWLWDRSPWELTPKAVVQLQLAELLEAMPPQAGLMLDLKGVGSVGRRTLEALHARRPTQDLIVCGRWWPAVEAFAVRPGRGRCCRGAPGWSWPGCGSGYAAAGRPYGVSLHGSRAARHRSWPSCASGSSW
jgi:hypothetical protein